MRLPTKEILALAALSCGCLWSSFAHAAAQVALHEANTSVGIKPTSTANKWKLETDPAMVMDPDIDNYTPYEGSLSNTYDPTEFALATNPQTGLYTIGDTVQPYYPTVVYDAVQPQAQMSYFNVVSFNVETSLGDIFVNSTGDFLQGPDSSTQLPPNSNLGVETGSVFNVVFQSTSYFTDGTANPDPPENPDDLPDSTYDLIDYEINLNQINTGPTFTTGLVTAYGGDGDYFTSVDKNATDLSDPNSYATAYPPFISTSVAPEPASACVFALLGGLLMKRRRSLLA